MMQVLILSLLVCYAFAAKMDLVSFADKDPQAVCNDGSPSGYYWSESTVSHMSHIWVVWLQGGMWCFDQASCKARWGVGKNPLMTSTVWPSEQDKGGILSDVAMESPVYGANKAYVQYCTSDAHMGNVTASAASFGWHFRGHAVVFAVLKDLVKRGMGSGSNDVLLFGGTSAGGRGAMATCDVLAEMLPDGLKHHCILDSPLWLDMQPYKSTSPDFADETKHIYSLVQPYRVAPPACTSHFAAGEQWKCLFGQYRMPLIQTSFIMYASQNDAFQLGSEIGHEPNTKGELAYAEDFAQRTLLAVSSLKQTQVFGVYSSKCYNHAISLSSAFYQETVQGVSMSDALATFLGEVSVLPKRQAATASALSWVDTCSGFACGPGCRRSAPCHRSRNEKSAVELAELHGVGAEFH
mmetsp:Transcript_26822/g.52856  ORF Transcript_26822/g.52856 Transcript_26822/m.52856 type:complete len:409 (-) Transcript_26822:517-1743(-)